MDVADQEHQWFKFMLHYDDGKYRRLDHTLYTSQKFIRRNVHGERIDSKILTRRIPLNFRVESKFHGEFLYDPNPIFNGSDIEQCFGPMLYPPPRFEDHPPYLDDS